MQERNIVGGTTAAVISPLVGFYEGLIPFIILAIILIIADTKFGTEAAQKRGEKIRVSRLWRRAINKLVDYICWITLAGMFGQTFGDLLGIPALSMIIILVIYAIELTSCFNNYFEFKGIKKKINLFNLFNLFSKNKVINNVLEDDEPNKNPN